MTALSFALLCFFLTIRKICSFIISGTLSAFTNGGVAVSPAAGYTGAGLNAPTSVVIDSSGSVWVANSGNSTVTRVLGAADPVVTPLSTAVQNATLGAKP